jgi:hypothetical protein
MVKASVAIMAEKRELLVQIVNHIRAEYKHSVSSDPRQNTRPPMANGWRCVVYIEVDEDE